MTKQEGAAGDCHGTEVIEVIMILPTIQFFALEEAACRQNQSVARFLRRAISDFLRQPISVSAYGASEVGEIT
jgi:hypothetical protein